MNALWMIAASFFFATMALCVKYASSWFNSSELVFYRGLIGMAIMWALARRQGQPLATRYPAAHFWRSVVGVVSLGAWFFAIAKLPLATALTLNYMSSVWIAVVLLGGTLLAGGQPRMQQGPLVIAVLAGFAGVVLMLRPTIAQNQVYAGLIGLMSGLTAAIAYMQVMGLGRLGEPETRTVFYFAVGSTVAGALGMSLEGVSAWTWPQVLWLIPVGLFASLGQLCMTRAYSTGATLVVAALQYFGLAFGTLYGVTLFGDALGASGWAGMALVVASGIAATVLRSRAAPDSPAEEH